jgi:gamma-glutamyltranspeptidase/glutathione hydrolase
MPKKFCLLIVAALLLSSVLQAREPVYARHAMVVTQEEHATDVGLEVLRGRGNAVDAAVAIGFALAVTHPAAGNIGGGGFMLIRMADGRASFIDFRETAPAKAARDMYLDSHGDPTDGSIVGWRSCGIPGTVRGLELAHQKYGTQPWAQLLQPAIDLAMNGFAVSHWQMESWKDSSSLLSQFAESKRIFLKDGAYYGWRENFRQPELARTLQRIAEFGSKDFYDGQTAHLIAEAMQKNSGLITLTDLHHYRAVERKPLEGDYKGYHIITSPPPSSGGVGILQMLAMLDGTGYEKTGAGSAESYHYLAEVMRRFYADRNQYLGDPDFVNNPLPSLLAPAYIKSRRSSIDPAHATPGEQISPGISALNEGVNTTHYNVVDEHGNIAAVTYTLNASYGSGVTIPGGGFLMNDEMDDFTSKPGTPNMFGLVQGERNAIAPGKRPLSSMTPTILVKDGNPFLVLGAPGGSTIISAVLQVIVNMVDFGMNAQDAVAFPRIHDQLKPDRLDFEHGVSPDTLAILKRMGYAIDDAHPAALARVEAIAISDGWLQGAHDPRGPGKAAGY